MFIFLPRPPKKALLIQSTQTIVVGNSDRSFRCLTPLSVSSYPCSQPQSFRCHFDLAGAGLSLAGVVAAFCQPQLVEFTAPLVVLPLAFFYEQECLAPRTQAVSSLCCLWCGHSTFPVATGFVPTSHGDGTTQLRSECSPSLSASLLLPGPRRTLLWPFQSFQVLSFAPYRCPHVNRR